MQLLQITGFRMSGAAFHRATVTSPKFLKQIKIAQDHDSGSGWGLKFCISNQLWGSIHAGGPQTPLGVGGSGSEVSNTDSYLHSSDWQFPRAISGTADILNKEILEYTKKNSSKYSYSHFPEAMALNFGCNENHWGSSKYPCASDPPQTNDISISRGETQVSGCFKAPPGDSTVQPELRLAAQSLYWVIKISCQLCLSLLLLLASWSGAILRLLV